MHKIFTNNYKATIGSDFVVKDVYIPDQQRTVTLQIWDTAGQERFQALSSLFWRGADGLILVYDVSDPSSLDHLSSWLSDFLLKADISDPEMFPIIVIANKCDVENRKVSQKAGIRFSQGLNAACVEMANRRKCHLEAQRVRAAEAIASASASASDQGFGLFSLKLRSLNLKKQIINPQPKAKPLANSNLTTTDTYSTISKTSENQSLIPKNYHDEISNAPVTHDLNCGSLSKHLPDSTSNRDENIHFNSRKTSNITMPSSSFLSTSSSSSYASFSSFDSNNSNLTVTGKNNCDNSLHFNQDITHTGSDSNLNTQSLSLYRSMSSTPTPKPQIVPAISSHLSKLDDQSPLQSQSKASISNSSPTLTNYIPEQSKPAIFSHNLSNTESSTYSVMPHTPRHALRPRASLQSFYTTASESSSILAASSMRTDSLNTSLRDSVNDIDNESEGDDSDDECSIFDKETSILELAVGESLSSMSIKRSTPMNLSESFKKRVLDPWGSYSSASYLEQAYTPSNDTILPSSSALPNQSVDRMDNELANTSTQTSLPSPQEKTLKEVLSSIALNENQPNHLLESDIDGEDDFERDETPQAAIPYFPMSIQSSSSSTYNNSLIKSEIEFLNVIPHIETSAKTGSGVEDAFRVISRLIRPPKIIDDCDGLGDFYHVEESPSNNEIIAVNSASSSAQARSCCYS